MSVIVILSCIMVFMLIIIMMMTMMMIIIIITLTGVIQDFYSLLTGLQTVTNTYMLHIVTHALKWSEGNCVQMMCKTLSAYHMPHVACFMV